MFLESIVIDNFDIYTSGEFPEQGGWSVVQKNIRREEFRNKDISIDSQNRRLSVTGEEFLAKRNYYIIDNKEFVSGTQSFKLESSEDSSARAVKKFSLPARIPFDISDGNFAIVAESFEGDKNKQESDFRYRERELRRIIGEEGDHFIREQETGVYESHYDVPEANQISDLSSEDQSSSETEGSIRMLSGSPESTYYIYSFDGKLLAEYNTDGVCVREYIYMGNQLMAEYRPQENKYYYYTSDQVNSTRIVTDDSGTKVYSAAYDPYGGIQKTWVNTYDPKLKFSGKERDSNTGLDYFGARYYGHSSYRFISVDPVINREEAISNPQLWNLYSYCRNNPVTFMDLDGRTDININLTRKYEGKNATFGEFTIQGTQISGVTLERLWKNNIKDKSCIPCDSYRAQLELYQGENKAYYRLRLFNTDTYPRKNILWHRGNIWKDTEGCILPGIRADYKEESISGSAAKLKEVTDFIRVIQFVDSYILKEPTNIRVNVGIDKNLIGFIFQNVRF